MKMPSDTIVSKPGKGTDTEQTQPKILIHDSNQMARILHVNKFSRSGTIDRVLKVLELVQSTKHTTVPECFDQFSPEHPTKPPHRPTLTEDQRRIVERRQIPNVWIIDTEFANLKGQGNRYDLSVNITNLISGETIVNHRLELPISVDALEEMVGSSGLWQARRQFE